MKKIILLFILLCFSQLVISQDLRKIFSDTTLLKNDLWKTERLSDYLNPEENYDNYPGYFNRGIEKMRDSLFSEAIIEFNKSIDKGKGKYITENIPNLNKNQFVIDALFNIASCHLLLKNTDSAKYYYEKIIDTDPYQTKAYLGISSIYYFKEDYDAIISILNSGISAIPGSADLQYNLAIAYLLDNKKSKAKRIQKHLIEVYPEYEQSYVLLGTIYILEQKFNSALKTFTKSIEINPDFTAAYYLRGSMYIKQKDYLNSYKDFLKFNELDSLNPTVIRSLAILDFKYGYDSLALARYLKLIDLSFSDSIYYTTAKAWDHELYYLFKASNTDTIPKIDFRFITSYYREYYWGDKSKAKELLDEYVKEAPSSVFAKRFLLFNYYYDFIYGNSKYDINRDTLIAKIDELTEIMPQEANLWFLKGDIYIPRDLTESINNFKTGSKINPEYANPYINIGNGYFGLKKYDSAAIYFSKAIDHYPDYVEAYAHRAESYEKIPGKKRSAIKDYKYILSTDEFVFKDIKKSIAICYADMGNFDTAIIYLNELLTKFESNTELLEKRGYAFLQLGKYDKAIQDFTTAIDFYNSQYYKDPYRSHYYFERGNAYFYKKNYYPAIDDYKTSIKIHPEDAMVHCALADCYRILNGHERAMKHYNKAIEYRPDNKWFYFKKAYCYSDNQQFLEAIQCFSESIRIDTSFAVAYGNIGWNYYKLGKFRQCIQFSQKAISLNPNSYYASFNIAIALLNLGYFEKAYEVYFNTKSINDEKENPDYSLYIKDLLELKDNNKLKEQVEKILLEIFKYEKTE